MHWSCGPMKLVDDPTHRLKYYPARAYEFAFWLRHPIRGLHIVWNYRRLLWCRGTLPPPMLMRDLGVNLRPLLPALTEGR